MTPSSIFHKPLHLLAGFLVCVISSCTSDETSPTDIVTDIDGNVYNTITIGDQVWMAANLKVTRYNDGTPIDYITDNSAWIGHNQGAYTWYDNDEATYKEAYGALYNGHAAASGKLCPEGWLVASYQDWMQLINYISGSRGAGGNMLKSCRQIDSPLSDACNTSQHPRWEPDSVHYGHDEFGFSALPGGLRFQQGEYIYIGYRGYWYTSTPYNIESNTMISMAIGSNNQMVGAGLISATAGLCVRCIKKQDPATTP